MVEKMCKFYGTKLAEMNGTTFYDFPEVEKLTDRSVLADLQRAAFGYRAKFIQQAACKIVEFGGLSWIEQLKKLPYEETKAELMKLPGIGAKVINIIQSVRNSIKVVLMFNNWKTYIIYHYTSGC